MTATDDLAREIADLKRRLSAVERSSQLGRSSIDGGALTVNAADGTQMLSVGLQDDGGYSILGANGGRVVASDLDLPNGTITETLIADDAISTPKLRANAVTADTIAAGAITAVKIAADAIDGRTITGVTITGADVTADGGDGSYVRIRTGTDSTAIAELVPAPQAGHPLTAPGRLQSYSDAGGAVALNFQSPAADGQGSARLELWSFQQAPNRRAIIAADRVEISGEVAVNGVEIGQGLLARGRGTATATATTSEAKDGGVGNVTFTAVAGRVYEVTYTARVEIPSSGGIAAQTADLRVRDGGAAAPTTSSPIITASSVYLPIVGGAGATSVVVSQTFKCPDDLAAGTHTLGGFYARTAGTTVGPVNVSQSGGAARELRVEDIGTI